MPCSLCKLLVTIHLMAQRASSKSNGRPRPAVGRCIKVPFRHDLPYFMFGHEQPFAQSSQHGHSQLQFGQSLQQSSEQQPPSAQFGAVVIAGVELLTKPAATNPVATDNPPSNLTNIVNSLS
jgi:hypothetical protein